MFCYNRIHLDGRADVAKSNNSKNYWHFNRGFKFQVSVHNGCHDFVDVVFYCYQYYYYHY